MKKYSSKYLLFLLFFVFTEHSYSQEFKFDYVTINEGLTNSFVYDIEQDERGYLYLSTAEGIGVFNGKSIRMITKSDGLTDNFVSCSYLDKNGNIWFGHNQGGSSVYFNGKFAKVHPGAGIGSDITDIAEDNQGRKWFLAQSYGLYCTDDEGEFEFHDKLSANSLFFSLYIDNNNLFFLGTDKGMEVYKYYEDKEGKVLSKTQTINDLPKDQVVKITPFTKNQLLIATLNSGFFLLTYDKTSNFSCEPIKTINFKESLIITDVLLIKNTIWISTLQSGLIKAEIKEKKIYLLDQFNEKTGLKTNAVNACFIDRENVIRIATFGEGLASKEDDLFTYYFKDKKELNPFTQVKVNSTQLWVAKKGVLQNYDKQNARLIKSIDQQQGMPFDEVTNFIFDIDSNIYFSTTLNGLFVYNKKNNKVAPIFLNADELTLSISDIKLYQNQLYIGTLNGVYQYDITNKGIRFFNVTTGLPHNSIGYIYISKKGEIYIGTNSAFLSKIENGTIVNYQINNDLNVVNVNMIVEDKNGEIWFSTSGNGVYQLKNDSCINYNTQNGLSSNYCNGLCFDNKELLWISHFSGLSQLNPVTKTLKKYDESYGLDHRFLRASIASFQDEIWFGTENGLVKYSSKKLQSNIVPPITSILNFSINGKDSTVLDNYTLPYGEYELSVEFIGLSLKKSSAITYQTYLEGYDNDWSKLTTDNVVKFPKVLDGSYTFYVKSFNADGTEGNIAKISIIIASPYWKKWWFYLLCAVVLMITFIIVLRRRERSLIKYQQKLENELAMRTKEVVEQKNKIEEINKDITDSINYAQRIQNSILPTKTDVEELFPDSFVYFRPKDVVSGDFYWSAKLGSKKIMVCADCTGHGVPGGFMSMISHILIREAINEESLKNPALILLQINSSINEVLHQSDELTSNKDGLDVAVVVYDEEHNNLKFAGAIRPLYLYRNGIRNVFPGDRFSIGGINATKNFITKEIDIEKGDTIYLFSDGFPDQFGGSKYKKMKVVVFNELLDQISHFPLKKQLEEIDSFFTNWKGEHAQMDDVLVIGFRI
jgi:ligand-binding sensor domain-containing protein/serine phosphatase RsbU (regulator of sigma subunit)